MPIACILMMFAPIFVAVPMATMDNAKEQKVNQICVEKFKTTQEIKECKAILMKVQR